MDQNSNYQKSVGVINTEKMQFRVISKKPQYATRQDEMKIREDVRRELYQIFKKYE